jgi:hypothetical protein
MTLHACQRPLGPQHMRKHVVHDLCKARPCLRVDDTGPPRSFVDHCLGCIGGPPQHRGQVFLTRQGIPCSIFKAERSAYRHWKQTLSQSRPVRRPDSRTAAGCPGGSAATRMTSRSGSHDQCCRSRTRPHRSPVSAHLGVSPRAIASHQVSTMFEFPTCPQCRPLSTKLAAQTNNVVNTEA